MQLQISDYCLFGYLLIALYLDVRHSRLPNWFTLSGMVFGLMFHMIISGVSGLVFSMLGLLAAGLIFLILYLFRAMGAGDVKLFAAIGAIVGVELVLYLMMYSIIFGGIIGIFILLFTRTFLRKMTAALFALIGSYLSRDFTELENFKAEKGTRFPFMYAVIPAVITTYYYYTLY